jgi:two-component system, chemotaxis family, protein-glutamate methylesterase/glutaminase
VNRDVIVVGGSAGALEALMALVARLPADLPAAVFIVLHRGPERASLLAEILERVSPLPVIAAAEGEHYRRGHIYVAAPDRHLLIGQDHVHVRRGPYENRSRPAIDPLFRSAAVHCSSRVIGVVLSGLLNDGTAGLMAIKSCAGLAVVQDPADALCSSMPQSALERVEVDAMVPAAELGALLGRLARQPCPPAVLAPKEMQVEALIAAQEFENMTADQSEYGRLSAVTCPDCHGVMYEIDEGGLLRFRCHTGHAFTAEALALTNSELWERALYNALRIQEEQATLVRTMTADARRRGAAGSAALLERRGQGYAEGALLIRQLLAQGEELVGPAIGGEGRVVGAVAD